MKNELAQETRSAPINRFEPPARLLAAVIFAAVTAVLRSVPAACCALAVALAVLPFCRIPAGVLLRRWCAVNFFVLFIWLLTPWATPGEPVYPGSVFTREGLVLCVLVTLKANALFFVFIGLISTMTFSELSRGLEYLRVPSKLCVLILFTARGLRLFTDEFTRLKQAAVIRGFEMKTDLRTYKTVAAIIALLFIRAVRRSQVLQDAMALRGFDGRIRTLGFVHWKARDTVLVFSSALVSLFLIAVSLV